jgi:TrmH family RNA methyltransferase
MRPLSARNPRVQHLTKLVRRREERARQRALVVEGPVLVSAALDAGVVLRDLYLDQQAVDRPAVVALLERVGAEVEPWVLPPKVLDRVGDVEASQGVIAVVDHPRPPWPRPDASPFVLVLGGLQIPGNVGTLIRAASAAGADAVVCAGGADPFSPKVVRAAAGTSFTTPVVGSPEAHVAVARLRADGYRIGVAVVRGGEAYDQADLSGPLALVLGSEAHGLPPDLVAEADVALSIPMAGPAESLNVAMAGTILAFEVLRRRRADAG